MAELRPKMAEKYATNDDMVVLAHGMREVAEQSSAEHRLPAEQGADAVIKIWHATDSHEAPEPAECEEAAMGYPNRDTMGRTMYENSHFPSEDAAWDFLLRSAAAGQNLSRITYENAMASLAKARGDLAEDAARRCRIEEAYETFKHRKDMESTQ